MNQPEVVFRFEGKPTLLHLCAYIGSVFFAFIFLVCGVGVYQQLRNGDGPLELGLLLTCVVMTVVGAIAGVAGILGWLQKVSWHLELTTDSISWSYHRESGKIACSDISAITIQSYEGDILDITVSDGSRKRIPDPCLGKLEVLCCKLFQYHRHIPVSYNSIPTCEICGAPTHVIKELASDRSISGNLPTHYLCWRHRSDPTDTQPVEYV